MSRSNFIFFLLGAVCGTVGAAVITQKRCHAKAEEEIAQMRSYYYKKSARSEEHTEDGEPPKKESWDVQHDISVIPPEEFGREDDYETISLTYYADGILADDRGEPIEDVEVTVGNESLRHFGEYEEDSVFVRNSRMMCDYEILLDLRTYSEANKSTPHRKAAEER